MLDVVGLVAMMSVPPPSYDHDDWNGPALLCGASFSLQLEEGESVRRLFPGTALQQASLNYFIMQREGGEMQLQEKDSRARRPDQNEEPAGSLEIPGARFVFGTFEENQTGATDGDLNFIGDEHPTVYSVRVIPRFQGDIAVRDAVLRRLGRLPTDREACTPPE